MKRPPNTPSGSGLWAFSAALLIGCFLVLAFLGVHGQDVTLDERYYFGVGKALIETREWVGRGALLHPPLSYYVSSLPLLGLDGMPSPENAPELLLSRLTSLVVFGLPLLVAILLWARDLYGRGAALVALALACFSPTLLAHAALITPDVPLTATGLVALYLFWRSERAGRGFLAWGTALGLALLAKASAWLIVASLLILGSLAAVKDRRASRGRSIAAGLAVALLILNLGYGFKGVLDWEGKASFIAKVPNLPLARGAAWASAPLFPLPYLWAMAKQLGVGQRGWPAFLMGEVSQTGWWYYFLFAFMIKETLPFLLLLAAAAASMKWTRGAALDELCLVLPVVLFFAAFSLGRVQIGIRYVLPAFPFLFLFASRLARLQDPWRWPVRILVGGLLAWHAASAVRACPHFIAYFNEIVGGPRNGYRYLGDSNLDWGQNRSRMEAYARQRGILLEPDVLPPRGLVAVRANRLQGIADRERYRLLREEYDPVDHVGYNWLVYDLERNRRFPPESILPVMSDSSWLTSSSLETGWEDPAFGAPGWEPAVVASTPDGDEFIPSRDYPGTTAALIRCPRPALDCFFRRSFALKAAAARAVLYFAARDRYEVYANGRLLAARASCAPIFVKEEHRLEARLQPGPNVIAIRISGCGEGAPRGLFVEMRVAHHRARP